MKTESLGVVTSLVTPFMTHLTPAGLIETEIDSLIFSSLLTLQVKAGIETVAVGGWIGEGPTLARTERITLIEMARSVPGHRLNVLAHIGSNSTERSVLYAMDAQEAGADGLILVVPYYSRPTTAGIIGHVRRVANATDLPLFLEFDARAGITLSVAEMARLMQVGGVAGVIDHSDNPLHVECVSLAKRRLAFLSGHEPTSLASLTYGADGVFSTLANIVPSEILAMRSACERGDLGTAKHIHERLRDLSDAVEEGGVAAIKTALYPRIGLDPAVRLPLVAASSSTRTRIREAIRSLQRDGVGVARESVQ